MGCPLLLSLDPELSPELSPELFFYLPPVLCPELFPELSFKLSPKRFPELFPKFSSVVVRAYGWPTREVGDVIPELCPELFPELPPELSFELLPEIFSDRGASLLWVASSGERCRVSRGVIQVVARAVFRAGPRAVPQAFVGHVVRAVCSGGRCRVLRVVLQVVCRVVPRTVSRATATPQALLRAVQGCRRSASLWVVSSGVGSVAPELSPGCSLNCPSSYLSSCDLIWCLS